MFQVATFGALHLHQSELNQNLVLSDIMVIVEEVDAQLAEAVRTLIGAQLGQLAAEPRLVISSCIASPSDYKALGSSGTSLLPSAPLCS